MNTDTVKISVIIVNYNVRDFLEQALESVFRALKNISSEVIVVDNNSFDGSVQMVMTKFPEVKLIPSRANLGFSAGNNLALKIATGEYVVLLNPDTLVQENTFETLLNFFDKTADASAATCKIINPDGSFSIDCRHSIPTPATAFWKILGLNRLFPKSKIFGKYNLTYLNENETYPVEAISGSFMMIKKEVIKQIGLLDENFFMYCEDIDYCHRINLAGGKIYYVHDTQIVHYKGESTKVNNLDYVVTFNRSLYQFYKKHYTQKYIYPFKWLILIGVIARGTIIFSKNSLKQYYPILLDLILINLVIFFSFWIRIEYKNFFYLPDFFNHYIIINIITSFVYVFSALFFDLLKRDNLFREKVFKVLISTFLFVAALTAFFKQFAFSRLVVLMSAFASSIVMIGWRVIFNKYSTQSNTVLGKQFLRKKSLVVGDDKETLKLLEKIGTYLDSGTAIEGVITLDKNKVGTRVAGYEIVAAIEQLEDYIRIKKINIIIFSTHNIPYETILKTMTDLHDYQIEFKMVPGHLEYMIGKSNVERFDSISLPDIQYAYGKAYNRFIKRLFDFSLSTLILPFLLPFYLYYWLFKSKVSYKEFWYGKKHSKILSVTNKFGQFALNILNIWIGKISFVGAPITFINGTRLEYKPGLTGIIQVNKNRVISKEISNNFEMHYLKNQSFFLDFEIMLSAIFKS